MSALSKIEQGRLGQDFSHAANSPAPAKARKGSVVVCVRMDTAQRDRLHRQSKGRNLSAYIRSRLFDGSGDNGQADLSKAMIARILGQLGQSGLAANMGVIAKAVQSGTLDAGPDLTEKLEQACADIAAMRHALIGKLGIKPV